MTTEIIEWHKVSEVEPPEDTSILVMSADKDIDYARKWAAEPYWWCYDLDHTIDAPEYWASVKGPPTNGSGAGP